MRNLLLVAISFSILSCQPQAPEQSTSPKFEKIDQLVAFQRSSFEVPGLAVGLIKEGKVIYDEGHGLQGLGTQQPLTRQSLFHMASVSKPFVATAIVQLVEQGKIDLEEKLTHYLPYFTMADERYKAITIQQMLNHTSGIPDVDDYEWDKPQYDDGAAERYARQHATIGLDFTPGERFSYSNAAFDIRGDPASIKITFLSLYLLISNVTSIDPAGVKSQMMDNFFKSLIRLGIGPGSFTA